MLKLLIEHLDNGGDEVWRQKLDKLWASGLASSLRCSSCVKANDALAVMQTPTGDRR